jgi:hypothetical protein
VPVICISDGLPAAADPVESVPDKPQQTSAEAATTADPPGSTAESGACTTEALGTVEKLLDQVKLSEVTGFEGILPEGTTHASCDLAAPIPTQSQGQSVKETMVFGPSEWDVRHLNLFHIHPGAQIHPVRLNVKSMDLIYSGSRFSKVILMLPASSSSGETRSKVVQHSLRVTCVLMGCTGSKLSKN